MSYKLRLKSAHINAKWLTATLVSIYVFIAAFVLWIA